MPRQLDSDRMLDIVETLLKAQLTAIDELRRDAAATGPAPVKTTLKRRYISQTQMAYEVLKLANGPLHVNEIVQRIKQSFGATVSRDSLVSAMIKKVIQGKQFVRTEKNTYGLLGRDLES